MDDIQNSNNGPSSSGLGTLLSDPAAIARIGNVLKGLGLFSPSEASEASRQSNGAPASADGAEEKISQSGKDATSANGLQDVLAKIAPALSGGAMGGATSGATGGTVENSSADTADGATAGASVGSSDAATGSAASGGLPFSISPELMSRLPAIMSSLSSSFGGSGSSFGGSGSSSPVGSFGGSAHHPSQNKRLALLHALRPYLSEHRRDAIDRIVKITALGDLLKKLK